jgi:hypothetical protein
MEVKRGRYKKHMLGIQPIGAIVKKLPRKTRQRVQLASNIAQSLSQLKKQVLHPDNLKESMRAKGLVLPGSKYVGPGNELDKGVPTSEGDMVALRHDLRYDDYAKRGLGKQMYTSYSDADARAIQESMDILHRKPDANALVVAAGMGMKKLAHKMGLVKRIRDRDLPDYI